MNLIIFQNLRLENPKFSSLAPSALADTLFFHWRGVHAKKCVRVYVLLGDGEIAEGSVWEAVAFSSYYQLDNLCIIADINRLGQSQATALGHDVETYKRRFDAFGFVYDTFAHYICTKNTIQQSKIYLKI